MQQGYYRLPARVITVVSVTVVISLIVHFTTALILYLHFFNNDVSQFHFTPRSASMIITNTTRYGLYDVDDWASLTPPGHGFVRHPDQEEYYSVSLYHQIHCLGALRGLIADRSANLTELKVGHAEHCLNFLRQILLCDADTTLEPTTPTIVAGRHINVVTGIGVTHQCRDWTQVWEFAENNYNEYQKGS